MYVQALPTLSFVEAVKTSLKKFCTFSGRARRSEFWYLYLFLGIIISILSTITLIFSFLIITSNLNEQFNKTQRNAKYPIHKSTLDTGILLLLISIIILIILVLAIPLISASVRRLHDTGRSGFYYLLSFFPFGNLILLIFFIEDSQQNSNEYGPSPKYVPVQVGPPINNSSQVIQVSGMPALNSQFIAYPQANPYQQYSQNSQAPILDNLYQEPIQAFPSNQAQIATPMVSP